MLTRQIINNKLECEFKQIETQLDFSFDKINNFIDYVFNLDFPISKFTNRKSQTLLPKLDQFQIIPQSDIIQELTPFINSKIKHQVQIKLLSVQGNQQSFTNSTFTKVQQSFASSSQLNLRPFTFQLIKDNPIKQHEWCFAIAFNEDCSIVAAGSDKLIKIYEFRQGNLRLIQLLNKHLNWVSILNFMKKSNQLLSGDNDGAIFIWSSNNNNEWIWSQTLKQQNGRINCLIMYNNEDSIISSSNDTTIKFWMKQSEWICQQTITDHKHQVYQLSLNDKKTKVIFCGWDQLILLIEYSEQNKQWMVIQTIQFDCQGFRLCFINDNLFTFQPKKGNSMQIYEMNKASKQFTQTKQLTVNQGDDGYLLLPQQYIKSKQLLVSKHDNQINLIRMKDNDQFKIEQSIQFSKNSLFGYMSDDGKYLITWDDILKEISIRIFRQQ